MSDRLDRLEETVAHQTRVIDELNEVVSEQAVAIERLRAEMLRVRDRVSEVSDQMANPHEVTKPPHW